MLDVIHSGYDTLPALSSPSLFTSFKWRADVILFALLKFPELNPTATDLRVCFCLYSEWLDMKATKGLQPEEERYVLSLATAIQTRLEELEIFLSQTSLQKKVQERN